MGPRNNSGPTCAAENVSIKASSQNNQKLCVTQYIVIIYIYMMFLYNYHIFGFLGYLYSSTNNPLVFFWGVDVSLVLV